MANKVKIATLFIIALLFLSSQTYAARPQPASDNSNYYPANTQHGVDGDDKCEAGVGEDECLARRTLAAHLDYIYTQKHNP